MPASRFTLAKMRIKPSLADQIFPGKPNSSLAVMMLTSIEFCSKPSRIEQERSFGVIAGVTMYFGSKKAKKFLEMKTGGLLQDEAAESTFSV